MCASAPSVRAEGPAAPLVWSPEAKRSARDQCGRLGGNCPMNISRKKKRKKKKGGTYMGVTCRFLTKPPPPSVLLNQFETRAVQGSERLLGLAFLWI